MIGGSRLFACGLALIGAAGCAGGVATVSGKVTFQGKALTTGTVSVVGPDGLVRQGPINPDGTYTVAGVAAGPVQVGVASPRPTGDTRGGAGRRAEGGNRKADPAARDAAADRWFPVPEKYQEPTSSGLTATLRPGANRHDITLP